MNRDELSQVLALHAKWLRGEAGGERANLRGVDLRGVDLRGVDLRGVDLMGVDLRDADLGDVLWEAYLQDVVPALLTAGGKALAEVATPETWACHRWERENGIACPIATAFDCESLSGVPALYRQQAERFIQFFDADLIPYPFAAQQGGSEDG